MDDFGKEIFDILFDSPTPEKVARFLSEERVPDFVKDGNFTCQTHVPNLFEGENLSQVCWRLFRCNAFTPEARKQFLTISEMVRESIEIEAEVPAKDQFKVRKNLARYIPS